MEQGEVTAERPALLGEAGGVGKTGQISKAGLQRTAYGAHGFPRDGDRGLSGVITTIHVCC